MAETKIESLTKEQVELLRKKVEESLGGRFKVNLLSQYASSVYFVILESKYDMPWGIVQYFGVGTKKMFHNIRMLEGLVDSAKVKLLEQAVEDYNNELENED